MHEEMLIIAKNTKLLSQKPCWANFLFKKIRQQGIRKIHILTAEPSDLKLPDLEVHNLATYSPKIYNARILVKFGFSELDLNLKLLAQRGWQEKKISDIEHSFMSLSLPQTETHPKISGLYTTPGTTYRRCNSFSIPRSKIIPLLHACKSQQPWQNTGPILSSLAPLRSQPSSSIHHSASTAQLDQLAPSPRPCLFLDRDGILIVDRGYQHRIQDIIPIQDCLSIIRWARAKDWWVIILSNQAGIARNYFPPTALANIETYLESWLRENDLDVDAWLYCPFHPAGSVSAFTGETIMRKPAPGMLLSACLRFPIDIEKSIMIGDKDSDRLLLEGPEYLSIQGNYPLSGLSKIFPNHKACLSYLKQRAS